MRKSIKSFSILMAIGCSLLLPCSGLAWTQSKKMAVVAKWGRFEQAFKSSVNYSNPLQEATLTIVFISPLGETNQVYGFWDGGKTWRVRFSPDQPGHWSFKTTCSDAANKGLHNQAGELMCTAPLRQTRFNLHGPVRVALDHRHLEHADGTPFFWLADTVWNGARVSEPRDWDLYARTRAAQKFTVAQWAAAPGSDLKKQTAFTGKEYIAINPDFFKRLDAKLETLARAGILSAITPFTEMQAPQENVANLPDDQAALLARYAVARWGAEPVAWLVAFDGEEKKVARWKRIGHAAFSGGQYRLVVVYAGKDVSAFDQLRDQRWVDVFGYPFAAGMTDDSLKQTLMGPMAAEWSKEPARPLIAFLPYENSVGGQSPKRLNADDLRHASYWSLFLTPPAGISYGAQGVEDWDGSKGKKSEVRSQKAEDLPLWHKAMFMPGAKQMTNLVSFVSSNEFWRFRPQPSFVANQPGAQSPQRFIAAAGSEAKDLAFVYVPEDRTLEILTEALPSNPNVSWLNPRTGETSPAVAVVGNRTCQFPTPDPGDWLLVMRAGK